MPEYMYKALALNGETCGGTEVAESQEHLREVLANRDLILKSARENGGSVIVGKRSVSLHQFADFNKQFVFLLKAGIPIVEALALLKTPSSRSRLEYALGFLLNEIRQGSALSEAAAKQPDIFDPSYLATLAAGEQSGSLVRGLEEYQRGLELRVRMRRQISKALIYPAVLMLTLACVLVFLFIFVIPNFIAMYRDLGSELPEATQILIFIAEQFHWLALAIGSVFFGAVFIDRTHFQTPDGLKVKHRLMQSVPLLGHFRRSSSAAETARILSTLISAGLPITHAMKIAVTSLPDKHFSALLRKGHDVIITGEPVAKALGMCGLFPATSLKMLEAGETGGNLGVMLGEIAAFHSTEVEQNLQRFTALLEPALTLVAGVVVGGIIVAMYLPMFSLMEIIQ